MLLYKLLNNLNFLRIVGVLGIGMKSISNILNNKCYVIQGLDMKDTNFIHYSILYNKKYDLFSSNYNLLIKSSIINNNNISITITKRKLVLVISRAEIMSLLLNSFNICITGSHGKTTTTAFIYNIFMLFMPSIISGGNVKTFSTNNKLGFSNINVIELDESDKTFLFIKVNIGVITNVDNEHLDFYYNIGNILLTYYLYINKVMIQGCIITCIHCNYIKKIYYFYQNKNTFFTYGISYTSDIKVVNMFSNKNNIVFDIFLSKKIVLFFNKSYIYIKKINLNLIHKYNIINYLAAVLVKYIYCYQHIEYFTYKLFKTERRLDSIETIKKIIFIDDYAHHPTEIKNILGAIKHIINRSNNIFVIFEPHKNWRLNNLYKEFFLSFINVSYLSILDIYSQKQSFKKKFHIMNFIMSCNLCKSFSVFYCPNGKYIRNILNKYIKSYDYVIFIGAGKISSIAYKIICSFQYTQ